MIKSRSGFLYIFILALVAGPVVWSGPAAGKGAAKKQPDTVASILSARALKGATTAFVVWDLDLGETLYEKNIDRLMTPASNMKVLTAAAATLQLGTEYQFRTDFYGSELQRETGAVRDLFVIGTGDPTFSEEFFESSGAAADALAAELHRRGLRSIAGDMVLDGRAFSGPDYPNGWDKEDAYYCYGMKIGALSIAENCLIVNVTGASKSGRKPRVETDPPLDPARTVIKVKTIRKGKNKIKVKQAADGVVTISGQVRVRKHVEKEYPVPRPDLLFGNALAGALKRRGIGFNGKLINAGDWQGGGAHWSMIASIGSPYLPDILSVMNKKSDNFIAELMLRTLGVEAGRGGTIADGALVSTRTLADYGLVPKGALEIYDGSGLSRKNKLTPRVLMLLFRAFYNSYFGKSFIRSLAQPGKEGTMKKRLVGTDAEGVVWAKTGALRGVCSLSGYFMRRNGNVAAFSMIMNGYSVHSSNIRALQDRLVLLMLEM